VAAHALLDALLGAANLGDKGSLFPSTDPRLEGISSLILLERTTSLLAQNGWRIVNLDATILAQRPHLSPFIDRMRSNIAASLSLEPEAVSLKATTTDHLGFTGREEGMAAYAVTLIETIT
jgi:2-C-methyl-D-erythritol 2,4-cyclodiphosphate synthase